MVYVTLELILNIYQQNSEVFMILACLSVHALVNIRVFWNLHVLFRFTKECFTLKMVHIELIVRVQRETHKRIPKHYGQWAEISKSAFWYVYTALTI